MKRILVLVQHNNNGNTSSRSTTSTSGCCTKTNKNHRKAAPARATTASRWIVSSIAIPNNTSSTTTKSEQQQLQHQRRHQQQYRIGSSSWNNRYINRSMGQRNLLLSSSSSSTYSVNPSNRSLQRVLLDREEKQQQQTAVEVAAATIQQSSQPQQPQSCNVVFQHAKMPSLTVPPFLPYSQTKLELSSVTITSSSRHRSFAISASSSFASQMFYNATGNHALTTNTTLKHLCSLLMTQPKTITTLRSTSALSIHPSSLSTWPRNGCHYHLSSIIKSCKSGGFGLAKSYSVRWNTGSDESSNNNTSSYTTNKGNKDQNEIPKDAQSTTSVDSTTTETTTSPVEEVTSTSTNKNDISSSASSSPSSSSPYNPLLSTTATRFTLTKEQKERLQHIVYDQFPGIIGVCIAIVLLVAPVSIQQMKKRTNSSSAADLSEDPVDEFVKLVRSEWETFNDDVLWGMNTDDDDDENNDDRMNRNVLQKVLTDVLNSKALQVSAKQFAIQIITADEFKQALHRLVKELWMDLITDPDTLVQVIKVLEFAIHDPAIRNAAQKLLLQLVDDPAVRQSIIQLIQRLSIDQVVQDSVVQLITESAHVTLTDPDILESSMAFATDVVGDDIVQRSAGEALRNTFGHAFAKPVSTVALTSIGVGLIVLGIVSVGYSRSTEQEIIILERAFQALQVNAAYGISRIVTWPIRTIHSILFFLYDTILFPIVYGIGSTGINTSVWIYTSVSNTLWYLLITLPYQIITTMEQTVVRTSTSIVTSIVDALSYIFIQIPIHIVYSIERTISQWIHVMTVVLPTSISQHISSLVQSTFQMSLDLLNTISNSIIAFSTQIYSSTAMIVTNSVNNFVHSTIELIFYPIQTFWNDYFLNGCTTIENELVHWLDSMIDSIISNYNTSTNSNINTSMLTVQKILDYTDRQVVWLYYRIETMLIEYLKEWKNSSGSSTNTGTSDFI